MAVSDQQLVTLFAHPSAGVRSAALELITSSYSDDTMVIPAIFAAWDLYGVEFAFRDFPLVSHLPVDVSSIQEMLERAHKMSEGRKLTDRSCRCAGKLLESISIASPAKFADHLDAIAKLKHSSKIFFRVSLGSMQQRSEAFARDTHSLLRDMDDGDAIDVAIALECLFLRGEARSLIERGLEEYFSGEERTPLSTAVLELATRHPLSGFESQLLKLVDDSQVMVADAATIGLVRCRSPKTLTLLAESFRRMSRLGQLRSAEIIRRCRLPKSTELLHFLLPHGREFAVQDAIRIAEILLFDWKFLEEWLEAFLLADDNSLRNIASYLTLVEPLAKTIATDDWPRIEHLIGTRLPTAIQQTTD